MPRILRIFPTKGILLISFFIAIIERKGIIDAMEKDSRIPFSINKKIKKYNCFFLLLLKKKNNLNNGFFLIKNILIILSLEHNISKLRIRIFLNTNYPFSHFYIRYKNYKVSE
tara:strand:+ start:100 stop:438 length:339 start_codon:yes stop_codon:yes gene_type:complete